MNVIKRPQYIFRRTEKNDFEAVNCAYNEFTGRTRTLDQYLWQWVNTPFEPSESWVIEHADSKDIVGHHGVMALSFKEKGKSILVGKTENTFVLTGHSKKLYYPRFEKIALKKMKNKFIYIYTTSPNAGKGAVGILRRRLGYSAVGRKACFCLYASRKAIKKIVSERFPFLRPVSGFLGTFHSILQRTNQMKSFFQVRQTEVVPLSWSQIDEVEEFWKYHSKNYGITADRTSAYIKWRYADNPYSIYDLVRLIRKNQILGYAVLENQKVKIDGMDFSSIIVDDLIVANGSEECFYAAFSSLTHYLSTSELVLFLTLIQNDSVNRAIRRFLGPLKKWHTKESNEILVWGNSKKKSSWYYTNILSEGIMSDEKR